MSEFTKGEWQILPEEDDKEYIRIRGTGRGGRYKIANVIDLKDHHDDSDWCELERKESIANARLIAAAPELYAALKETSKELANCIDLINENMRKNISACDLQPPDYYDYQTCYENQVLLEKIKGEP